MEHQTNAQALADILRVSLPRLPWCFEIESVECVDEHSVRVSWKRLDFQRHVFDISYGEVEAKCGDIKSDAKEPARKFMRLLKDKMEIVAHSVERATSNATLDRLSKQGKTVKQQVVACDKCDRLLSESSHGKTCPHCSHGKGVHFEVEQPRMPTPGLVGRSRRIG